MQGTWQQHPCRSTLITGTPDRLRRSSLAHRQAEGITQLTQRVHSALVSMLFAANSRNITPPEMATVRCDMRIASSWPPITAVPCTHGAKHDSCLQGQHSSDSKAHA